MIIKRGSKVSSKNNLGGQNRLVPQIRRHEKSKREVFRAVYSHNTSGVDIAEKSNAEKDNAVSMNRTINRETKSRWINIDISSLEATGKNKQSNTKAQAEIPTNNRQFEAALTRGRKFNDYHLLMNLSKESNVMVKKGIPDLKEIFSKRKAPVAILKSVRQDDKSSKIASKRRLKHVDHSWDVSVEGSDQDLIDLRLEIDKGLNKKSKLREAIKPWNAQERKERSIIENPVKSKPSCELNFRFLEQIKRANELQKDSIRFKEIMKTKGDLIMETLFKGKSFNTKNSIEAMDISSNSSLSSRRDISIRAKTNSKNPAARVSEKEENVSIQDALEAADYSSFRAKHQLLRKPPVLPLASKKANVDELSLIRAKYSFLDE